MVWSLFSFLQFNVDGTMSVFVIIMDVLSEVQHAVFSS